MPATSHENLNAHADKIIDGKALSLLLRERIGEEVPRLKEKHGIIPGLAVVLVGDDPASQVYVRNKGKATIAVGMHSYEYRLDAQTSQEELISVVKELNNDPSVHGILVQLPLPAHIDSNLVINTIDPAKDVDGFHVINAGKLAVGQDGLVPCTPLGCIMMLKNRLGDLCGQHAIVIGRSNIVGKPMAQLLLQQNCTVTIAHSRTRDLAAECARADIVVAAVGRPEMVRGDWIKNGATVIDVGINRVDADNERGYKLVGDVCFDEAVAKAAAITPVPGGVGPMTIACLLANTLKAACMANGLAVPNLAPAIKQ